MDRLIIPDIRTLSSTERNTIMSVIDNDAYRKIKDITEKSGMKMSRIAGMMVKFASERAVIESGITVDNDTLVIPNIKPLTGKGAHELRVILDDSTYNSVITTAENSGMSLNQLTGIYVKFGAERSVIGEEVIVDNEE